ncbi:SMC-Scp complex subunit ScpB, partial [Candidatus Woesearchaeota archaeon]|nr:SMC-Scp complex subunit ScpB [Candidatus Woesearchaeota archaeon]
MENTPLSDLKNRLEALLFSSGKPMQLEELSRITKEKDLKIIEQALIELKKDLEEKKSSIMLIQDGTEWKLAVRENYMPFVRKVVSTTELPKTILQTLAVVAHKAPTLQSDVIKIRTNKAYRHLDFLEEKGYISREKKGRTKLIKLTQKFFDYFDIPADKLKQKFAGFKELENVIETKEKELETKQGKLEVVDILETYDVKENSEAMKEMLGGLEIYKVSEPEKKTREKQNFSELRKSGNSKDKQKKPAKTEKKIEKIEKEAEALQEAIEEKQETTEKTPEELNEKKLPKAINVKKSRKTEKVAEIFDEAKKIKVKQKEYKSKGLFSKGMPPEVQKKVDEKVQEMLEGEQKENDSDTTLPEMQEQDEVS